jgi:hypothetical protein
MPVITTWLEKRIEKYRKQPGILHESKWGY